MEAPAPRTQFLKVEFVELADQQLQELLHLIAVATRVLEASSCRPQQDLQGKLQQLRIMVQQSHIGQQLWICQQLLITQINGVILDQLRHIESLIRNDFDIRHLKQFERVVELTLLRSTLQHIANPGGKLACRVSGNLEFKL